MQVLFGTNSAGNPIWGGKAASSAISFATHGSGEDSYTLETDGSVECFGFPFISSVTGTATALQYNGSKEAIMESFVGIQNGAYEGFFGLNVNGSSALPAKGSNTVSVGFVTDSAGALYIRAANGSAVTETAISALSAGKHLFRIEYSPTVPRARYYIDGSLVGTITTNLPTSSSSQIGIGLFNDTGDSYFRGFTAPVISPEM